MNTGNRPKTHQKKCLLLVDIHHWHLVHIHHRRVSARLQLAILFDRAEDVPRVGTVAHVAGEAPREEDGFGYFGSAFRVSSKGE